MSVYDAVIICTSMFVGSIITMLCCLTLAVIRYTDYDAIVNKRDSPMPMPSPDIVIAEGKEARKEKATEEEGFNPHFN